MKTILFALLLSPMVANAQVISPKGLACVVLNGTSTQPMKIAFNDGGRHLISAPLRTRVLINGSGNPLDHNLYYTKSETPPMLATPSHTLHHYSVETAFSVMAISSLESCAKSQGPFACQYPLAGLLRVDHPPTYNVLCAFSF